MFARLLEMKAKKGQAGELCNVIEAKGLPILKKYSGFLEVLALVPQETPDTVVAMSFWTDRESAEKYRTESYRTVAELYQPFLEGAIQVRGGDVPVGMASLAAKAKAAKL
jgi:quinol monooxygenase YgiN